MPREAMKKGHYKCWIEVVMGVGLQFIIGSGQLKNT